MALRAWDAEVLGRLCAFINSFFFSAWRLSRAARLPGRELVWSSRSKILPIFLDEDEEEEEEKLLVWTVVVVVLLLPSVEKGVR